VRRPRAGPPEAAAGRAGLKTRRESPHDDTRTVSSKVPKPVSTHGVLADAVSETLANLWQATLSGSAADALCLVELRGFEPLTPCMPSRDCVLKRCWSRRFCWSRPKLG
jgi:hypothetical protein